MFKARLAAITAAASLMFAYATQAVALGGVNIGVGVSGAWTGLSTSGSHTLRTTSVKETTQKDVDVVIPAIFLQLELPIGFVIGYEHNPGEAELGKSETQRSHITANETSETATQVAQAEVSDHHTYYLESPGFGPMGLYAVVGWSEADVITNENLQTGSAYGDTTVEGWMYGLGMKQSFDNGFFVKAVATFTEYDDISITSDGSNIVAGDIEAYAGKLALGYNF